MPLTPASKVLGSHAYTLSHARMNVKLHGMPLCQDGFQWGATGPTEDCKSEPCLLAHAWQCSWILHYLGLLP